MVILVIKPDHRSVLNTLGALKPEQSFHGYLAILGIHILMVSSDDGAVDEQAPHHHDGFKHFSQGHLHTNTKTVDLRSARFS